VVGRRVWFYYSLSLRDVVAGNEMQGGVPIIYEAIQIVGRHHETTSTLSRS
jgi:hypothetical protein